MMNMDSFTNIDGPRDMAKIFDSSEYAKWKSFRQRRIRVMSDCVCRIP